MSTQLSNTMDVINVAHATLEYKLGVGGIKSVTTGLVPALANKGINPSVITPFYDVYNNFYESNNLKKITTVTHIYKGKEFRSDIWCACTENLDSLQIYHYLIKPEPSSSVTRIFEIGNEKDLYRSFPHSEAQNRVEYFNGALAAMIRMPNENIPVFDIFHGHTWHSGIAGCLIKEFENLPPYQPLIRAAAQPLKKIPYVVSTIHMLLKGQDGCFYNSKNVANFLNSLGLPPNFADQFPNHNNDIRCDHLKQLSLSLIYADAVNGVSKGLIHDALNVDGQGIDNLIKYLHDQNRLLGITNGINTNDWIATKSENIGEYKFDIENIRTGKSILKQHLVQQFPNLNPNKKWFIFIGRFGKEKGVDYLPDLLEAVKQVNGNLIILGSYVVTDVKNGKIIPRYQEQIEKLIADNDVLVIDNTETQKIYGKKLRAASDCAVSLSENEACGLVPMELMTCGAISVVPKLQGLPDTVISLHDNTNGTGFLYDPHPENRKESLKAAIVDAVNFLNNKAENLCLNAFLAQLVINSKQHDWNRIPSSAYKHLYKELCRCELLTADKIRNITPSTPLLHKFNAHFGNPKILPAKNPRMKIWQIGFNKAGSTTLFKFFAKNRILSVHYGLKDNPIAVVMYNNHKNSKPLVDGEFDRYTAYFDMENIYADDPLYIGKQFFKTLDTQYPGSKFILNTRDKQSWLKSRLRHVDPNTHIKYIDVACEKYKMTVPEVVNKWSQEWDEHLNEVLEHFKDRPEDLLVFDIDNDSPQKICEFFEDYFMLDPELYEVYNRTDAPRHTVG